jgi:hypothetical protein
MRNGAGLLSETLRDFLEMNLPKAKKEKKPKFSLGVQDSKLGNSISETMQVPLPSPVRRSFGGRCAVEPQRAALARRCQVSCKCNEMTNELLRGVRAHFSRMVKGLKDGDIEKAQLGLAHSYSRSKVPLSGYKRCASSAKWALRIHPKAHNLPTVRTQLSPDGTACVYSKQMPVACVQSWVSHTARQIHTICRRRYRPSLADGSCDEQCCSSTAVHQRFVLLMTTAYVCMGDAL